MTGTGVDGEVVERTLLAGDGVSGARLERLTMADGRVLIDKHVDLDDDWLSQVTGDEGRIGLLWDAGVFADLPDGLDSAVVGVEHKPPRWHVVMRDVTDTLVADALPLSRDSSRRILGGAASLHRCFTGRQIPGLCSIVDRLAFLTPGHTARVVEHPLRDPILAGWERFAEVAPSEVASAIIDLCDRPELLADALAGHPSTLLHGDLKLANIGLTGDSVILLDWGTCTLVGPPALDLAWYLAVNGAAIDAALDEQLADVEAALAPSDLGALPLAMLGQLVTLGWEKALGATSDDETTRQREAPALEWWCRQASDALDSWSPST